MKHPRSCGLALIFALLALAAGACASDGPTARLGASTGATAATTASVADPTDVDGEIERLLSAVSAMKDASAADAPDAWSEVSRAILPSTRTTTSAAAQHRQAARRTNRRRRKIGPFTLIGGGEYYYRSCGSGATADRRPQSPSDVSETLANGRQALANAQKALDAGDLAAARVSLRRAAAVPGGGVDALRVQLERAAADQLEQADAMAELGRPLQAMDRYRRLASAMAGFPVARTARQRWETLNDAPEARSALQQRRAEDLRRALFDQVSGPTATDEEAGAAPSAEDLVGRIARLPAERQARAFQIVRTLATRLPDCPAGREAMELHLRLVADTDVPRRAAAWSKDRSARRLFAKARTYHQAGLLPQAAGYYRQFLACFPDDRRAAYARDHLADIDGEPVAMTRR